MNAVNAKAKKFGWYGELIFGDEEFISVPLLVLSPTTYW
jgi:hypothetical protein